MQADFKLPDEHIYQNMVMAGELFKAEPMKANLGKFKPTQEDVIVASYPRSGKNRTLNSLETFTSLKHYFMLQYKCNFL